MKWTNHQTATLALLALGIVGCYFIYPHSAELNRGIPPENYRFVDDTFVQRILLGVAAALAVIPFTREKLSAALDKLHTPSVSVRRWTAAGIFLLSQPLLYFLAIAGGRVLLPYWHDENFYRLQTTFLAHGKFALPDLALPDFFDVPYVFVKPMYAPAYFPGTALLHVPGVWLHLPYFITPLLIAGVILSLLYLIATELLDGMWGLLAVIVMLSLVLFRWLALVEMSHAAGAMWAMVVLWSFLAWRRTPHRRLIVLAAFATGWYAITRPLDCLTIVLPIACFWAWELRHVNWRTRGATAAIVIVVISPFIALQLAFDRELTGHALRSPMGSYYRTYMDLKGIGLEKYDPTFSPPTISPIIKETYTEVVAPRMRGFTTLSQALRKFFATRLPMSLGSSIPTLLLLVLVPPALMDRNDRRTSLVWLMYSGYMVGAAFVFQFLDHYVIAVAPLVIVVMLTGGRAVVHAFPSRKIAAVFVPLAIFALAMHRLCLNDQGAYQRLVPNVMRSNYIDIPANVKLPAIVLFRRGVAEHAGAFDEEPVYNWDVVNPNDAPIIRAHDLGPSRDEELFRYYATRQPERNAYIFDRESLTLKSLGNVSALAIANEPAPAN